MLIGLLLPIQRAWLPGMGTPAWLLDVLASWQPYYAILWALTCLIAAGRNRRWLLGLPLVLLPLLTASKTAEPAQGPPDIVVVAANVHDENTDPRALLTWLHQHPANVVVLSELNLAFAEALKLQAHDEFPHQIMHPNVSPPGIGTLSDRPLRDARLLTDELGAYRLEAEMEVRGSPVTLVAIHPKPPKSLRKFNIRDQLLRSLAKRATTTPLIVIGDSNATPWSSALLSAAPLLKRATGAAPTWPVPLRGIVGVGIDHVLVSKQFQRVSSSRGPDIGSDHYPVRAELHLGSDTSR